jgi:hypothetical protein
MTHEERMDLAGRLRDLVLARYGASVLAVFVTSSTARGLDLAHSDLELTAVHRDGAAPEDRSFYHRGILIEVEHIEESRILDQKLRHRWPLTAGGYRGRVVLYEKDRWTERLDAALDARDAADPIPAQRAALLEVLEYRDKLRNARITGDDLNVRTFGFFLADSAANLILFLNREAMVTTRLFFPQAFGCAKSPPGFRAHMAILLGLQPRDSDAIAVSAEDLTNGLVRLAAGMGIEVESAELLV